MEGDYAGIADFGFLPLYLDPNPFLDPFLTAGTGNPTGWTDPVYRTMLAEANGTLEPGKRLARLAQCECHVLTAMPFLPLYSCSWQYLCKPFVRGLASSPFDTRAFKYAWIDTNWRPS